MFGVDLSSNQTVTSYTTARSALDFTYIRVFRSNGAQDTAWRKHHDGLAGIPRAPYLFLRPPTTQPLDEQFGQFWDWCGAVPWEWGPVIDAEYAGVTSAVIKAAVAASRKATGRQTTYVYEGIGNIHGAANPSGFLDADVRLIGARYVANNQADAFANLGYDNPALDIVQYWNKVAVPGFTDVVDGNSARRITKETTVTAPTAAQNATATWQAQVDDSITTGGMMGHLEANTNALVQDIRNTDYGLKQLGAKLDALTSAVTGLSTEEAAILAAVQGTDADTKAGITQLLAAIAAQPTGGQVDVAALATNLAPALVPLLPAPVTADQISAGLLVAFKALVDQA